MTDKERSEQNMALYNSVRSVPDSAKRAITAGRLKGKTDINPMWRIRMLTENFGPCGAGWYTSDVSYWTVPCADTHELAVFCQLQLMTRAEDGTWNHPVYGIGGNTIIVKESRGLYVDDEAYKKAYTDALSVACKALGIGADVYWDKDSTKYTSGDAVDDPAPAKPAAVEAKPAAPGKKKVSASVQQELGRVMQLCGVDMQGFAQYRAALVDAGIVPNVPGDAMTDADWMQLIRAVEQNFAGDAA